MAGRKANGEGTISTVIRNGKTYYKANITVGWIVMVNRLEKVLVVIKSLWYWIK